ncbi:hypothetical protein [Microvirga guangxiensis]|uniref:Uncharacterized protein n=1 Tax=Microvirga guangxiensis TaxID=549386 RepID=A0A1G5EC77_9HYPH|nr:hypothetical protein [Microvirga guangxiensis]SCY24604.1 hypothetical protein SAMN02927923_00949 [Microvirga guangxiensis]
MTNSSQRNQRDTGGKPDIPRQVGMSHQESRDHNRHNPAQEKQ